MRLVTLATKQANTPPSNNSPTDHPPAQQEELEGGKLSDQPKMAEPPTPLSASILAHDDEALKASILDILNSTNDTCQAKSAKIMDAILQHRRKKVLELDRENIPPATARFLSEGGSNPNQTLKKQTLKKKKGKLKEAPKPMLDSRSNSNHIEGKSEQGVERKGLVTKVKENTKEEKEEEEEEEEEREEEEEEEEDDEEEEEEGNEEQEEGETEEEEDESKEMEEGSETEEQTRGINIKSEAEGVSEEEKENEEGEGEEEIEWAEQSRGAKLHPAVIKAKLAASLSRILSTLARKKITLGNKTLQLLDANLQRLSVCLSQSVFFKVVSSSICFQRPGSNSYHTIHMDKLLAALSLPTLSLFRFILASRIQPKRFSKSEKFVILKIIKLSHCIPLSSIPSKKIRSICI